MTNFERAVEIILRYEGGEVNDPNDPGGHTKYGISKAAFPTVDIPRLTRADAKGLYRQHYWQACRCDEMPGAVALLTFDAAVNMGTRTAGILLQRALGVSPDGIIGPVTLSAANAADRGLLKRVAAERATQYAHMGHLDRYWRGWFRRLFDAYAEALTWDS